jgi:hypothetical protein
MYGGQYQPDGQHWDREDTELYPRENPLQPRRWRANGKVHLRIDHGWIVRAANYWHVTSQLTAD